MIECYSTAGISITQVVLHHVKTPELPRRIYTFFVLREKLENNAAKRIMKTRSDDPVKAKLNDVLLIDHRWK